MMKKNLLFCVFLFLFYSISLAQISIETDKFKKKFLKKYDFIYEVLLELKNNPKGNFFKEVSEYYYEVEKDTLSYYHVQYNVYAKTSQDLAKKTHTLNDLVRVYYQKVPLIHLLFQDSQNKPYTFPIKEGTIKNKKEYEIIIRFQPDKEYFTSEVSIENNKVTNVEDETDYSHFAIFFTEKSNAEKFRELLLQLGR